jgi:hypothetical protein
METERCESHLHSGKKKNGPEDHDGGRVEPSDPMIPRRRRATMVALLDGSAVER